MVSILRVAQLGTAFTTDPAISLKNYLKDNWATVTGYTPPLATAIRFDTKFGNMSGENFVVIENMPQTIKPQTLGKSRTRTNDVKRIQILCIGHSSINNRWHIEQHIDSLINANPRGMVTDGIDQIAVDEFVLLENSSDNTLAPGETTVRSRSRALCTLIYDKIRV